MQDEVLNHAVEVKLTPEQMSNKTVTDLAAIHGGVLLTLEPDTYQFANHAQAQTFVAVVWDWTGVSIEVPLGT